MDFAFFLSHSLFLIAAKNSKILVRLVMGFKVNGKIEGFFLAAISVRKTFTKIICDLKYKINQPSLTRQSDCILNYSI